MRLVVIHESLTGNTRRAGELIGAHAAAAGHHVDVFATTAIGLKAVSEADMVVLGTWVDGFVLFGHRPGRAGRLWKLPVLDRKPVALFMTYAIEDGKALQRFNKIAEAKGAEVIGGRTIRRDRIDAGAADFTASLLDAAARTA
jgi:hypothetical protein